MEHLIKHLLSTNYGIIDEQHREIENIINQYYESGERTPESLRGFLEKLGGTVKHHFETEEKLMKDSKYENYFSHKQEHDRFMGKLKTFSNDNIEELFIFMRDWLHNHTEMKDLRLANYLNENGQIQKHL